MCVRSWLSKLRISARPSDDTDGSFFSTIQQQRFLRTRRIANSIRRDIYRYWRLFQWRKLVLPSGKRKITFQKILFSPFFGHGSDTSRSIAILPPGRNSSQRKEKSSVTCVCVRSFYAASKLEETAVSVCRFSLFEAERRGAGDAIERNADLERASGDWKARGLRLRLKVQTYGREKVAVRRRYDGTPARTGEY